MTQIRELAPNHPDFLALQSDPVWDCQRCLVSYSAGRPSACLAFHLDSELYGAPANTGVVGHYEAQNKESGVSLLLEALSRLRSLGASCVLGPINGNIWSRFRLAHQGLDPAFFLEPSNPQSYIEHFLAAGFVEDAVYQSRIVEDLKPSNTEPLVLAEGFRERAFQVSDAEVELRRMYEISIEAFADNLYHKPISFEAFRSMHLPLIGQLDPELFIIIESPDGSVAAFLLAYPDFLQPHSERVVAKTLGVLPKWRRKKLGTYLLGRIHQIVSRKGYTSLIHALMHVDNPSNVLSEAQSSEKGRVFRRYSLFRWEQA